MSVKIRIIEHYDELPDVSEKSFFHSRELFRIAAVTSGHFPYMAVAERDDGTVAAHMLAVTRRRGSLIPPYLFSQGRVYGEGVYADDVDRDEVFGLMLKAITRRFKIALCLYVEFSNISQKMFGYRHFRDEGYFPVSWQEVYQSLHLWPDEVNIDRRLLRNVKRSKAQGVTTRELSAADDLQPFYKLLRSYHRLKFRTFLPSYRYFVELHNDPHAHLFMTEYGGKPIGACACIYSDNKAYLWFAASKRKSHPLLHPEAVVFYDAISAAKAVGCQHFHFMNAGLPFNKSRDRDFILKFDGKPVAKYRWFRFNLPLLNRFLKWLYRE